MHELRAHTTGFITRCDAKLLGLASNALGAGRSHVDDLIDPAVGLYLEKKLGEYVTEGETLCRIHWNEANRLDDALHFIERVFDVTDLRQKPAPVNAVLEDDVEF